MNERVVIITGAAGNLGRAVAAVFESQGARLVLTARRAEVLRDLYGEENARCIHAGADLQDADQAAAVARLAVARFGRIDALCNLVGGFRMGPAVHETPAADLDFLYDINVRTALHMMQPVLPQMIAQREGWIVNIGAAAAAAAAGGAVGMGAYVAAKSALVRLSESASAELREQGVHINCVLPTIIDTPENRTAMPHADPSRWVAPVDLAKVIAFLASEDARAIHGVSLPVSGLS